MLVTHLRFQERIIFVKISNLEFSLIYGLSHIKGFMLVHPIAFLREINVSKKNIKK